MRFSEMQKIGRNGVARFVYLCYDKYSAGNGTDNVTGTVNR